jgi:hypothetical protein
VSHPPSSQPYTICGLICKITLPPPSFPFCYLHASIADTAINSGLEIATTFWWLVTWALLASEASAWDIYGGVTYIDIYGNTQTIDTGLPTNWKSAIDCGKASAGLGALEWVLFIITLVMFGTLSAFLAR